MFFSHSLQTTLLIIIILHAIVHAQGQPSRLVHHLAERQNNVDSECFTYGVDFADGGSYFINSDLDVDFSFVSTFEGCNDDQASMLLVNNDNSDQYLCSSVPTVPDDTPQLSTCPIQKSEMISGNWSILVLGNNGIGDPFAWQRNFHLFVALPQTVTATSTVTVTVTTTPVVTPDRPPVTTPDSGKTVVWTTRYRTITVPLSTYSIVQSRRDVFVTPSCTVPPASEGPDPRAQIMPTAVRPPAGARFALPENAIFGQVQKPLTAKEADQSVVTETATEPAVQSVTITAAPVTRYEQNDEDSGLESSRDTFWDSQPRYTTPAAYTTPIETVDSPIQTDPDGHLVQHVSTEDVSESEPADVSNEESTDPDSIIIGREAGVEQKRNNAIPSVSPYDSTPPPPTEVQQWRQMRTSTIWGYTYSSFYWTKTYSVAWRYTSTTTPTAAASECAAQGGHFGGQSSASGSPVASARPVASEAPVVIG